jgi:hypothetical protein
MQLRASYLHPSIVSRHLLASNLNHSRSTAGRWQSATIRIKGALPGLPVVLFNVFLG